MSKVSLHCRPRARYLIHGLLTTALLALAGCQSQDQNNPAAPSSGEIVTSGFIEAEEIAIASDVGGRIVALPVDEGATATAGAVLIEFDRTVAQAELAVAQAKRDVAVAELARVKAAARPTDVRQLEAAVALAGAKRDAAQQAWQDAQMLLSEQQALDLQIAQAQAQVNVARENLAGSVASQGAAQIAQDRYEAPFEDYTTWQAWIGVNAAGATYDGSNAVLAELQKQRRAAPDLRAQVDAGEATFHSAEAAVAQAQARLADLRAGASAEQTAAVAAQVRVADAAVSAAQSRLARLTVRAPAGGLVTAHNLRVGELAAPGATVLTLSDLDTLTLVVYVPTDRLNLVRLGQRVPVQVDGFADRADGRSFEGEIVHIADKAEFIPDNVQAADERAALVFAVKLRLANPDYALKPGVPAEAHFALAPTPATATPEVK